MSSDRTTNPFKAPRVADAVGIDERLTSDEREAFYDQSSDRSLAIVLGAIVENHLTAVLRLLMRREKKLADELFNPSGPLGPFGTKIRIAYMLRIIEENTYKDLIIVSKIRNRFAHDLSIKSFGADKIWDLIRNMHAYNLVIEIAKNAKNAKEDAASDESRRTFAYVMGNSASDPRRAYREAVRLLIHVFIDYERHIQSEEARLNRSTP